MTTRGQPDFANAGSSTPETNGETASSLPRSVRSERASGRQESPGQNSSDKPMEQVADRANLNAAWRRVRANGGAPDIDGITVEAFPEHLRLRAETLRQQLLDGSYRPSALRRVTIPKPNGGERQLGIPTVQDRLVQQALLQVLQPMLDLTFHAHSYGFRPGKSAHQAVAAAQAYIRACTCQFPFLISARELMRKSLRTDSKSYNADAERQDIPRDIIWVFESGSYLPANLNIRAEEPEADVLPPDFKGTLFQTGMLKERGDTYAWSRGVTT